MGAALCCWIEWKPVKVACEVLFLHLWEKFDFSSQTHVFLHMEMSVTFLEAAFFSLFFVFSSFVAEGKFVTGDHLWSGVGIPHLRMA